MSANPLYMPVPLGIIQGGATYSTIAIPLSVNLTSLTIPDGLSIANYGFNEIYVQAASTNTGLVYVCIPLSGQAATTVADTTGYTNVIASLSANGTWQRYANPAYANKWILSNYYLSFANSTDLAFGAAGRV